MSLPSRSLVEALQDGQNLILDGGLATALESRGHNLNHALWSAKLLRGDREAIRDVHRDFYLAGADVAITASYQASVLGLHEHLDIDADQAKATMRDSVSLAIEARGLTDLSRELYVAGSVGPYGAYLSNGAEYTGDYGDVAEDQLRDFHRDRISALLDAGADVLACETIPCLTEVKALCELLGSEFPRAHAWMSFTLKDAQHISDGTEMSMVAALVNDCDQIFAIGFNCIPLDLATDALNHLGKLTSKPLVIYPNSGEKWDGVKKVWYGGASAAERLPQLALEWQRLGARLIGGCCRMGFQDISMMRRAFNGRNA